MNRSAQKGTAFETAVVRYLDRHLQGDVERRARNGKNDRGDIAGVKTAFGERVVIECKNVKRFDLGGWIGEAELEAGNDDAPVGVVVAKRPGKGDAAMGDQYVVMTLATLTRLLQGEVAA